MFLSDASVEEYIKRLNRILKRKLGPNLLITNRNNPRTLALRPAFNIVLRLSNIQDYCSRRLVNPSTLFCAYKDHHTITTKNLANRIRERLQLELRCIYGATTKKDALAYIIQQLSEHQVGIAQLKIYNQLVPTIEPIRASYKNSSGFVLHDQNFPYICLPTQKIKEGEIEEAIGRQIYTLLYMVVAVALGSPNRSVNPRFNEFHDHNLDDSLVKKHHAVLSEIVIPDTEESFIATELDGKIIKRLVDAETLMNLSKKYKLTPRAILNILKNRGWIPRDVNMADSLQHASNDIQGHGRASPQTMVETLYGRLAAHTVMQDALMSTDSDRLSAHDAQHLLFGRIDKGLWRKLKTTWRMRP